MLVHPDPTRPFQIETVISTFAIGAVLYELDDDDTLHLVVFYSQKFIGPEINYLVYNKELTTSISTTRSLQPNGERIWLGTNIVSRC